jgi:diacylglycerol kinase family enzyme
LLVAAAVLSIVLAVRDFPRGVPVAVCSAATVLVTWRSLRWRGRARLLGLGIALLLVVAVGLLVIVNGRVLEGSIVIGSLVLSVVAARSAFAVHAPLRAAGAPRRPVLLWNGRSGGGKATRFHLELEARARGFDTVELRPGDDLERLVEAAIARGADGLAMAGGDGSQAVVARLAAEHDLPYACVPAGTRNHFALDLGVDRDDLLGALDAFIDGSERRVDLAEVNGRVFVNNVSLGVYADAVQRPGYREAKLRTLLGTLGAAAEPDEAVLRWRGTDGEEEGMAVSLLVSNNAYRLGRALGSGTRPRLDAGVLGIVVLAGPAVVRGGARRQWTAPQFEVRASHPLNAGIDGEPAVLESPLRFASKARALRVRIARAHPGGSPSAAIPERASATIRALGRIAFGGESDASSSRGINGSRASTATDRRSGRGSALRVVTPADGLSLACEPKPARAPIDGALTSSADC